MAVSAASELGRYHYTYASTKFVTLSRRALCSDSSRVHVIHDGRCAAARSGFVAGHHGVARRTVCLFLAPAYLLSSIPENHRRHLVFLRFICANMGQYKPFNKQAQKV
eukprot:6178544-Pleurochrysis_carterae.AAC.1